MTKRILKFITISILSILGFILILCACWYRSDIPVDKLEAKYFTPQSSYITINDVKIHVRQRGAGPVLFLLHGDPSKVKEEDVDRFYDLMLREGNRSSTIVRVRQPGKYLQDSMRFITVPTLII